MFRQRRKDIVKEKSGTEMINKFYCHNFKNIQACDLEFERINILIGPNNTGKSNFIKAITFFSEMLKMQAKGI